MLVTPRVTIFFGEHEPLDTWFIRPFQVKNITFNCCEQFRMYCKAMHFKDETAAQAILNAKNPRDHKRLGRIVAGYVKDEWENKSETYTAIGLRAKFTCNPDLIEILRSTIGPIGYASMLDKQWGIGRHMREPLAVEPVSWVGQNRLGVLLTRLRDDYFGEKAV